jgi:hypothetical protein
MMKTISYIYIVIILTLGCLLSACSDDGSETDARISADQGPPTGDGGNVTADGLTGDGLADQWQPTDSGSMAAAGFCGVLKDQSGTPVENVGVILCNDQECFADSSKTGGLFCVAVTVPGDYLFHSKDKEVGGKHLGDVMFPVPLSADDVAAGTPKDLGEITMPQLGPSVSLDPDQGGTLTLGTGMTLTVPAGATVLPPLMLEANVAVAKIDNTLLHPQLLSAISDKGNPAAVYLIVPVGVTFTSPASFELPAPAGIAAGTLLEIIRINDKTGQLQSAGEAQVDGSGSSMSAVSDKGLTALGWLLFFSK